MRNAKSIRLIAVTFCRNEEESIEEIVTSVLEQAFPPDVYVVVDDCSTDNTPNILAGFNKKIKLVSLKSTREVPRKSERGAHMHHLLRIGITHAEEFCPSWDFMLKVDADSVLPPTYVSQLLSKMERLPSLGIVSGVALVKTKSGYKQEKIDKNHASDGAKIYRRKCWDDIGGTFPILAFDTHTILKAKQRGWHVRSFESIKYFEKRRWGEKSLNFWLNRGVARCLLGFPFLHTVLSSLVRVRQPPQILGQLTTILTYMICRLSRPRIFSDDYYAFVKKLMIEEMIGKMKKYGKWS